MWVLTVVNCGEVAVTGAKIEQIKRITVAKVIAAAKMMNTAFGTLLSSVSALTASNPIPQFISDISLISVCAVRNGD